MTARGGRLSPVASDARAPADSPRTAPLMVGGRGLLSAGIFAFTLAQNEFLYALIFLTTSEVRTVPWRSSTRSSWSTTSPG